MNGRDKRLEEKLLVCQIEELLKQSGGPKVVCLWTAAVSWLIQSRVVVCLNGATSQSVDHHGRSGHNDNRCDYSIRRLVPDA